MLRILSFFFFIFSLVYLNVGHPQYDYDKNIKKWADFFSPSVLERDQLIKELKWFSEVSKTWSSQKRESTAQITDNLIRRFN
jgi:hypothetical protein